MWLNICLGREHTFNNDNRLQYGNLKKIRNKYLSVSHYLTSVFETFLMKTFFKHHK